MKDRGYDMVYNTYRCRLCDVCDNGVIHNNKVKDTSSIQNDIDRLTNTYIKPHNAYRYYSNDHIKHDIDLYKSSHGSEPYNKILPRHITLANPYGSSSLSAKNMVDPVKTEYRTSFYNPHMRNDTDRGSKSSVYDTQHMTERSHLKDSRISENNPPMSRSQVSNIGEPSNVSRRDGQYNNNHIMKRERYLLPVNNPSVSRSRYPFMSYKGYDEVPDDIKHDRRFYIKMNNDRSVNVYDIGIEHKKPHVVDLPNVSARYRPTDLSQRYFDN